MPDEQNAPPDDRKNIPDDENARRMNAA